MSDDPKHTPGPWDNWNDGPDASGCWRFGVSTERERVAEAFTEPNARLIAAAPDLLEVATFALEYYCATKECLCEEWGPRGTPCLPCRMRAAIAKATGGKP